MEHSHSCPQLQTLAVPTPSQSLELQTGGLDPGRRLNLASLLLWRESDRRESKSEYKFNVNVCDFMLPVFKSIPNLGCGRYPSFLAFELRPLLLWCAAALRVQPCAGGRRFSTSSYDRACLHRRTGVLGSRRD